MFDKIPQKERAESISFSAYEKAFGFVSDILRVDPEISVNVKFSIPYGFGDKISFHVSSESIE